jgi:hypothetical protein
MKLTDKEIQEKISKLSDEERSKRYNRVHRLLTNNGFVDEFSSQATIQDVITNEDIAPFVPKVIKKIIIDAIEPQLMIVKNLFAEVNIPDGQMVEIGAISAITAGKIAQGSDWPTATIAMDNVGATTQITVAKYGCGINVAREVIDDNQFDVIKLWLRAAGAALARLKEALAIRLIDEFGITVLDNATPANGDLNDGYTTGRSIAGAMNGTMTLNDLFDMWAYLALRGFTPDTIVMSPLAWKVFAVDPQLREIVLKGAVLATRRMPLGAAASGWPDVMGGLGLYSKATGDEYGSSAWTQGITPVQNSWNIPPSYLPSPLKVLVSHLVPFTERSGKKPLTDIIMCDSQRCGILVQRESPTTEEADIFTNDTHVVHIYERYGMNVFDQGKGIIVARNIVIDNNYVFDNVNSQTLAAPSAPSI